MPLRGRYCQNETVKRVVVTGASSGIGRATAQRLAATGWQVFAVARRADRLAELAASSGVIAVTADLTAEAGIAAVRDAVGEHPLDALVNIAGGARGADSVENGSAADWRWMFEVNVLATQALTAALLPALRRGAAASTEAPGTASIVGLTSTAAFAAYPGGGGYNAAKFAEHAMMEALRLELVGEPLRVIEVAPGMVKTEEFAFNRMGDASKAEAVYAGVEHPLSADDVARVIASALEMPSHVNLDLIVVRPVAQAAAHSLARGPLVLKEHT